MGAGRGFSAVFALIAAVLGLGSSAQASPPAKYCDQYIDATTDTKLAACTALIGSGEFSGQNLADIYLMRGRIYFFNRQDNKSALADYGQALKLSPRYAAVYYYRSWVHKRAGDKNLQIADLSAAIKINPDESDLYTERGMAYVAKGEVDAAIADFAQAIKLDPDNNMARLGYGLYQTGSGAPMPYGRKFDPNAAAILKSLESVTRP